MAKKMRLTITSYSKINVFLAVRGKRPDGYHEIETVFLPLSTPSDTVSLAITGVDVTLSSADPSVPTDARNLCHKAATSYAKAAGITPGWSIHIEKSIPVAGGMAGGSSNAAATLRMLQNNYNALSENELNKLAVSIGADVPFFLKPYPSIGRGVGEVLRPIRVKEDIPLVILSPLFPTSARWAYGHCVPCACGTGGVEMEEVVDALARGDIRKLATCLRNDLAVGLYRKFPALAIFRRELCEAGALAAEISGSGSSLFGICESNEKADDVIKRMITKYGVAVKCMRGKILEETPL